MDIYEALSTRRTIRDFAQEGDHPRGIDPALIRKIIGAGFTAPTNDHMRDWHFLLLNDLARRRELVTQVITPLNRTRSEQIINRWGLTDPDQRECYLDAIPKQFNMLVQSGCLVLPFYRQDGPLLKPKDLSALNYFASIWLCIGNILNAAASEGIFGVMRIPGEDERKTIKAFVSAPTNYELPCWLALGYPADDARRIKQVHIDLDTRIHHDAW